MNRQEFIDRLRAALSGKIPPAQVEDNVSYYQDYINMEMRKGRSEEEVLAMLGDPRLIARTIVETSGQDASGSGEPVRNQHYENGRNQYRGSRKIFHLPGWLLTIIVIIVVMLVFSLVFSVLSFLAPVIMVMAAVIFLVKLFRDWLN